MKRWLGMDLIDFAIHVFVTICVGVVAVEGAGPDEEIALAMVFASSAILFAVRRHVGLKRLPEQISVTAEDRIGELEARVAELELAQDRVAQLEERMDFSERLLVQDRSAASLVRGPDRDG